MQFKFTTFFAAIVVMAGLSSSAFCQTFNEFRISSPGAEDDVSNFFELFGLANTSLNGISFLGISSEFNPGSIDFVVDLNGFSLGSDGFFLASTDATEYANTDIATGIDFFGSPKNFCL